VFFFFFTLTVNYNIIQSSGNPNALQEYKSKQVDQLNELIRLTGTNLNKSDRTRVMVCITMDAHSRDIVINMVGLNITLS
jgi:dynein heavy chain